MSRINLNKLNIVLADKSHARLMQRFRSGNAALDMFLHGSMPFDEGFGRTYLWLTDDGDAICGYYNLSTGYIEMTEGQHRTRAGGSIHINCFALDESWRGQVVSETPTGGRVTLADVLLVDCLNRILELRNYIGFSFITLCATKEGKSLYDRNNFLPLEVDMAFALKDEDGAGGTPMYFPMDF